MQLVRLAFGNPKRTYWQKIKEIYFAILIDLKYSKNEILKMYLYCLSFNVFKSVM